MAIAVTRKCYHSGYLTQPFIYFSVIPWVGFTAPDSLSDEGGRVPSGPYRRLPEGDEMEVPYGECRCGCGGKTKTSRVDFTKWGGPAKGAPNFYLPGHCRRLPRPNLVQPKGRSRRLIALTKGKVAIVDSFRYEEFMKVTWTTGGSEEDGYYAQRQFRRDGKLITIKMHNLILPPKDGLVIDHKNRNSLDNRRRNLRYADATQNKINQKIYKNNKSGCRDVHQRKDSGRWRSRVSMYGVRYDLGTHATKAEAIVVRNAKAEELFKKFNPN